VIFWDCEQSHWKVFTPYLQGLFVYWESSLTSATSLTDRLKPLIYTHLHLWFPYQISHCNHRFRFVTTAHTWHSIPSTFPPLR